MSKKKTKNTKSKKPADLTNSVMSKIKTEKVKMKPKGYFVLGSILLGIGLASAFLVALTFLSVSTFHIRTSNPIGFLRYGALGGPAFLRLFPFRSLLISTIGIFGGLALLKKYDISYKKNFLGISIALVAGLATIAFIADKVGINERLQRTQSLKSIYKQEFTREDMLMGEVVSASESSMIIENPRTNNIVTLTWDEDTSIQNKKGFEVGDHVGAVGRMVDGEFQAEGIHEGGMGWRKNAVDSQEDNSQKPRVKGIHQQFPMRK